MDVRNDVVDAWELVVDANVVEGADEMDVDDVVDVDDEDETGAEVDVIAVVVGGRVVGAEVDVELAEVLVGGSVDVEVVVTTEGGSEVEVAVLDDVVEGTDVGSEVVVGATEVGGMEVVAAAVVVVAAAMDVKLEFPLPS